LGAAALGGMLPLRCYPSSYMRQQARPRLNSTP
jgi:hypothetical protein